MKKNKVSVVVATLNRQQMLITMLKELLKQKKDIFEIIVIDQTEGQISELKKFLNKNPEIRYFYFEKKNLPSARNFGWRKAQGDIILFLDDDSLAQPGLIRAHLSNYKNQKVGAVTGREILKHRPYFCTHGKGQTITKTGAVKPNTTSIDKSEVDSCWGANMSFRKKVLEEIQGFDEDYIGNAIREESDASMRLRLLGYKIIFEPEAKIIHLVIKTGGCRMEKRLNWYFSFFCNELYFFLKFFSWRYLPLFFLRKLRPILACMFYYGKAHPKALITPFLAFNQAIKTYQRNKKTKFVPKRIGIDAHHLLIKSKAGKEEFGYNLLCALAKNQDNNLYFIYAKNKPDFKLPFKFNWQSKNTLFWYLWVLIQIKIDGIDFVFCPTSYILPAVLTKKSVPVIHDLAVFRSDFKSQKKAKLLEKILLPRVLKCPILISISKFTKRDLLRQFPYVKRNKIKIIYPGIKYLETPQNSESILKKYNINKPYILSVGTIEPRKNFQGLIKAFLALPKNIKEKYSLIIVGKMGWYADEILATAKNHSRIKFLGHVPDKDLSAIFKHADIFALVSFWEGFGIPVLETFNFKVPAILSNRASLPEVAGKGAILVNPYSILDIKKALIKLIKNREIREKLVHIGQKRLKKFNYQKSAQTLVKILEQSI